MTDYAMYKGERFIDLGRIHSAIQERSKKMKQKRLDYTTDENINNLALIIIEKINKLKPNYLEIEDLANEIIKYTKQGIKYNEN